MSQGRFLPRTAAAAVLLAAALLAGGLTAAAASAQPATDRAAEDVIIVQPFAADSGDKCPMGSTKGVLGWHSGARTVDIAGTVTDHPLPGDTNSACAEDGRETIATFTALAPGVAAQKITQRANNGQRDFRTSFAFPAPIAQVTVQVCRHIPLPAPLPVQSNPPDYCGPLQTYRAPQATAG